MAGALHILAVCLAGLPSPACRDEAAPGDVRPQDRTEELPGLRDLVDRANAALAQSWESVEPAAPPVVAVPSPTVGAAPPAADPPDSSLIRRPEPAQPVRREPGAAGRGSMSWLRTLGSLAAVVGLILLLAWGYRAAGRGGLAAIRARHPGVIEVVSRTPLAARQAVYLLRVGSRLVLVGQSGDRLSALHAFEDAELAARLAGDAARAASAAEHEAFRSRLEDAERDLVDMASEPPRPDAADGGRISALR
ncbi:MAG TPA: flagellar biosynthetic protein FliO, partial [Phycisphaerae bacterium]|nr:flagellar biosynthetic protein FliO [Phycisphaerae bacterium]